LGIVKKSKWVRKDSGPSLRRFLADTDHHSACRQWERVSILLISKPLLSENLFSSASRMKPEVHPRSSRRCVSAIIGWGLNPKNCPKLPAIPLLTIRPGHPTRLLQTRRDKALLRAGSAAGKRAPNRSSLASRLGRPDGRDCLSRPPAERSLAALGPAMRNLALCSNAGTLENRSIALGMQGVATRCAPSKSANLQEHPFWQFGSMSNCVKNHCLSRRFVGNTHNLGAGWNGT